MEPVRKAAAPASGEVVLVRRRLWLVESAEAAAAGRPRLCRLACLEDDAEGEQLDVIWELEPGARVVTEESWASLAQARSFDSPSSFLAYLNATRWNCVSATDNTLLQSPFRAGIRIEDYQVEPLVKALTLPRVNLFLADDVGLGKTVEAGLVLTELLLRRRVDFIVVMAPPSVLLQWQEELRDKFGLRFEIFDRAYRSGVRRRRGHSTNPWTCHNRFLISHSLVREEEYAADLKQVLGDFRSSSLLILDEAHNAAPASAGRYAQDSAFTHAVRDLSSRFEHRMFLSATPHNGHSNSFSALLEMLDPQRFVRGEAIRDPLRLEPVLIRRLKSDLAAVLDDTGFPRRVITPIEIGDDEKSAPELALSRMLDAYRAAWMELAASLPARKRAATQLVLTTLQERLLSSVLAFHKTFEFHCRERKDDILAFVNVEDDDEGATDANEPDDAWNARVAPAEGEDFERESKAPDKAKANLRHMREDIRKTAARFAHEPDAKVRALVAWIDDCQCPGFASGQIGAKWNDTRVIVFTQFTDTLRYLEDQLGSLCASTDHGDERILTFKGTTSPERREEVKAAFNAPPGEHPVRILLANDAAREGLNLQWHCADLFHFDVPWNPSRIEQRNGRIDRKLQPRSEVNIRYFVYQNRTEDPILRMLVSKTETIRSELGSLSPLLGERARSFLEREGIRHTDVASLARDLESELTLDSGHEEARVKEQEAVRRATDLKKRLYAVRSDLQRSRDALDFSEDALRKTLDVGLALLGAPPMESLGGGRFSAASLERHFHADASWQATLDSLRGPRPADMPVWEWRRATPLRAVRFDSPPDLDNRFAHVHLAHPLTQRVFARLRSQGFQHQELNRTALLASTQHTAHVLLVARVSLHGANAARLHEEVVYVSALWVPADLREASLEIHGSDETDKIVAFFEEAAAKEPGTLKASKVAADVRASAARDVAELRAGLARVADARIAHAKARLAARGESEAAALRQLLKAQAERIESLLAHRAQEVAGESAVKDDAIVREQRRREEASWVKRKEALRLETEEEPLRTRRFYDVKQARVVPLGLVYLVPGRG